MFTDSQPHVLIEIILLSYSGDIPSEKIFTEVTRFAKFSLIFATFMAKQRPNLLSKDNSDCIFSNNRWQLTYGTIMVLLSPITKKLCESESGTAFDATSRMTKNSRTPPRQKLIYLGNYLEHKTRIFRVVSEHIYAYMV